MFKDTVSMLLITAILYASFPIPVAICQTFCLFIIFVKETNAKK